MAKKLFEIEKDVPLPERGVQGRYRALAQKMEVGDSVLVNPHQAHRITSMLKHLERKGTSKAEGEYRRVWRIS